MILSFLFYVILFYLAYKLIFDFIIPVYRTTRQVRRGFREMHERMNGGMEENRAGNRAGAGEKGPKEGEGKGATGEYIDFEEVKD